MYRLKCIWHFEQTKCDAADCDLQGNGGVKLFSISIWTIYVPNILLSKSLSLYKKYFHLIVSLGWASKPNLAEALVLRVKATFQWSAKAVSCNSSPWKRCIFSADFEIYGRVSLFFWLSERVPVYLLPGRERACSVRSEWKKIMDDK